eukprot:SAG31_NODE_92_length_26360_cov_29.601881_15_plen_2740_part_00
MVHRLVAFLFLLLPKADAQCSEKFPCPDGGACLDWNEINDGIGSCANREDEKVQTIKYCPRSTSGTDVSLTFRTDPGKDYATVGKQHSVDQRPCVFPFVYDGATHNECTKVCTTNLPEDYRFLNPDHTFVEDNDHGCKEHLEDPSDSSSPRQSSRLWCATELDEDRNVKAASYCTEQCATDPSQDVIEVDRWGKRCNPYLAMPFLSVEAGPEGTEDDNDPGGNSLIWRFASSSPCNKPGSPRRAGASHECSDTNQVDDPRTASLRYYLHRAITSDVSSELPVTITVYTESSPQQASKYTCLSENPTCCRFNVRIMDGEDPALLYPPFGPPQKLKRCESVSQCSSCQFEDKAPSASSDRICRDWTDCGECSYVNVDAGHEPGPYKDRECTPLTVCAASENKYLVTPALAAFDDCGTRYYTADAVCGTLEACLANQYEANFNEIVTETPCATEQLVYTENRQCQSLMKCVKPAMEVRPPTTNPANDGYIGDRTCQCPDPVSSSYPEFSDLDQAGFAFLPNTYYGAIVGCATGMDRCDYTCSECGTGCQAGKYQSRACTHSRINMDYCSNGHPISQDLGRALALAFGRPLSEFYPTTRDTILRNKDRQNQNWAIDWDSLDISVDERVKSVDQDLHYFHVGLDDAATVAELYSQCYYEENQNDPHIWSSQFNAEFCAKDNPSSPCFRSDICQPPTATDDSCVPGGLQQDQWFTKAAPGDQDREHLFEDSVYSCATISECSETLNEFEVRAPSDYNDRLCHVKRLPAEDEFVPQGMVCGTQVCLSAGMYVACSSDQNWEDNKYLNHAPQYSDQSACEAANKIWQLGEGTGFSDRVIAKLRTCQSCEHSVQEPETGCDEWDSSDCASGQWAVSNRLCQPVNVCSKADGLIEDYQTENGNWVCRALVSCSADQYQKTLPSESVRINAYDASSSETDQCTLTVPIYTSDPECECLQTCGNNAEQLEEPDPSSSIATSRNRQCQCQSGYYRTSDSDDCEFTCAQCTPCVPSSTYETSPCTPTSNRECTPVLAQCTPEHLYYEPADGAPTLTSNRECADKDICSATEYVNLAEDAHDRRNCYTLSTCDPKNEYEDAENPILERSFPGFRGRYIRISTAVLRGPTNHRWRVKEIELTRLGDQIDRSSWDLYVSSDDETASVDNIRDGELTTSWSSDSSNLADVLTPASTDGKQWVIIDVGSVMTFENVKITQDTEEQLGGEQLGAVDAVRIQWTYDIAQGTCTGTNNGAQGPCETNEAGTDCEVQQPGNNCEFTTTWQGGETTHALHQTNEETTIVPNGIVLNINNRACKERTKCTCTQYQESSPQPHHNRRCVSLTSCSDDQYESVHPRKMFLDDSETDFIYTSDRRCEYFSDYEKHSHPNQTPEDNQFRLVDNQFREPPSGDEEKCTADNVDGVCNDGGDCGPHLIRRDANGNIEDGYVCGEHKCPLGTDPDDCPPRTTKFTQQSAGTWKEINRWDDCLPFYHRPSDAVDHNWVGQFWNAGTVQAKLPDVIMDTDEGLPYRTITPRPVTPAHGQDETVLIWDFLGKPDCSCEGAECNNCRDGAGDVTKISAEDNFFKTAAWYDAAGNKPTTNGAPAFWNTPVNRVKITVKHLSGGHGPAGAVVGDSVNGISEGEYVCESQNTDFLSTGNPAKKYPIFPVTAVRPYIPAPLGVIAPCHDGNIRDGDQVRYIPTTQSAGASSSWTARTDAGDETCENYNKLRCQLEGHNYFNENGLSAKDACCVCGGGHRATGVTLEVSARDPLADQEAFALTAEAPSASNCDYAESDAANVYGPCFRDTDSTEPAQHTDNVYEPPVDDWCVAQRIDTATFTVYVFDTEPPTIQVVDQYFTVCNDVDDGLHQNYATIRTDQPADPSSGERPTLYPRRVEDNVDASISWSVPEYVPGSLEQHPPTCETTTTWGAKAPDYQHAPVITATRSRIASTTLLNRDANPNDLEMPQYMIGAWEIEFHATDSFGNQGSQKVQVTVNDCSPPTITCGTYQKNTRPGACYCTITDFSATFAEDNSGIDPKLTLTNVDGSAIDKDYKFPIGQSEFTATAVDLSGATTLSYEFNSFLGSTPGGERLQHREHCTVTCLDNEDPKLTCPSQTETVGDQLKLRTYKPEEILGKFNIDTLKAEDNSGEPLQNYTMIYTGSSRYNANELPDQGCLVSPDRIERGVTYSIVSVGDPDSPTDFGSYGAPSNAVGTEFVATTDHRVDFGQASETARVRAVETIHNCSDWALLSPDYEFPSYINKFLRFYVVDANGNGFYCPFSVLKESDLGLWKRTVDFEGVADTGMCSCFCVTIDFMMRFPSSNCFRIADCYTPDSSGTGDPTMTCMLEPLDPAHTSICFGTTCEDVESASHPVADQARVQAGTVSANSWPLHFHGEPPALNFSTLWTPNQIDRDDNYGQYRPESETRDCDDTGVLKGVGTDPLGPRQGYPFAKENAGYVQRVARSNDNANPYSGTPIVSAWARESAKAFDPSPPGSPAYDPSRLDPPSHYYSITDPDGTVALDLGRIDLPLNFGDKTPVLLFKYQFHPHPQSDNDEFKVKLKYYNRVDQRSHTINLISTRTSTSEFCESDDYRPDLEPPENFDETHCWVYYKAELTEITDNDGGAGIVPPGERWAWIDVSFELTSHNPDSRALIDDFAVGTKGCTLPYAGGYDKNAVFHDESKCDISSCCSKAIMPYAGNEDCSEKRHNQANCASAYGEQTSTENFNAIQSTIGRLESTQSMLFGKLSNIMGMLNVD